VFIYLFLNDFMKKNLKVEQVVKVYTCFLL